MFYTYKMKKQVIVIHGGDSFGTYEEFLTNLMQVAVSLEWLNRKDWKPTLKERLGEDYEVLLPRMPNPQNAKYREWKTWFEKFVPLMSDDIILVGHSLGASFLAKYLSEETFPKKVKGVFLIAPPFDSDGGRALVEFNMTNDLANLREAGYPVFLYHSEDDPVVDYGEHAKFRTLLPSAKGESFTDRQHFNQSEFAELVRDIKSLG